MQNARAWTGTLVCDRCSAMFPVADAAGGCPRCRDDDGVRVNLRCVFPPGYDPIAAAAPDEPGMARWADGLPLAGAGALTYLGEAETPLISVRRAAAFAGVAELSIKDESRNPGGTYRDRLAAVALAGAAEAGAHTIVLVPFAGHSGWDTAGLTAAVSAYAAAAGRRCVVLVPAGAERAAAARAAVAFGAQVAVVPGDPWRLAAEAVAKLGWFPVSGLCPATGAHPFAVEGGKSLAYELFEQHWGALPHWVAMPATGSGNGLAALAQGFLELLEAGRVDTLPRILAVRTRDGEPSSQIRSALEVTGGSLAEGFTADEVAAAHATLVRTTGMWFDRPTALAYAAVCRGRRAGLLGPSARVTLVAGAPREPGRTDQNDPVHLPEPTLAALRRVLR